LWEDDTGKNEYDCDSLQLAVKVGIIALILGYIHRLIMDIWVISFYYTPGPHDMIQLSYQLGFGNFLYFPWAILASLGYVGVFAMKRSNLGVVYPLLILTNIVVSAIVIRVILELGLESSNTYYMFHLSSSYVILIIGALLLLSIRNKTKNVHLLYLIVILRLTGGLLLSLVGMIIAGISVPTTDDLGFLITSIPRLILNFVSVGLLITFFTRESRVGCLEDEDEMLQFG